VQDLVVDDHELVVVAEQVISRACYFDPGRQQVHFEPAQLSLFAMIGIRDERTDRNVSGHGFFKRTLDIYVVETKNGDFNALFRSVDPMNDRDNAILGLNDESHVSFRQFPL